MTIEQTMKDMLEIKMNDGTVEKLLEEHFEKGVKNALENLFRSYGDATKIIEKKVKEVIIPHIQNYDYSKYVVKLDHILTEVLKESTVENRTLLENFKELVTTSDTIESITTNELFDKWMDFVEENVDTSKLEVVYGDGVSYENVPVRFEVNYKDNKYDWETYEYANIVFECEKDEEMNFSLRLSRWKQDRKEGYTLSLEKPYDIASIRYLSSFEVFLMRLEQDGTRIIIGDECDDNEVEPKEQPEPTFS